MLDRDTVLQARYRIDRKLGQGGMGAVYLATDERFGTTVALKQTLVTGDSLAKAFEREARLLNKLRHAALPVVIDYFAEADGQFLVMQYIPGDDLGALLATRGGGAFPVGEVLAWVDHLLDALEYLHGQDPPVVHRDIKPQNLKLTPRGEIVLLDFGLAKGAAFDLAQPGTTGTSVFGYTPHYAPFEQVRGAGTDPRSDLYALAATAYHLMTGIVPPDALSRAEAALVRKDDVLVPAAEVNRDVPHGVSAALQRAMAMDREERFPSAIAMRAALRDAERGTAVQLSDSKTRSAGSPLASGEATSSTVASGSASAGAAGGATAVQSAETQLERSPARRWILGGAALLVVAIVVAAIVVSMRRTPPPVASSTATPVSAPDADLILTAPGLRSFAFEVVLLTPQGTIAERRQAIGQSYPVEIDGATIEMVRIPGGTYQRGSADAEAERFTDEGPVQTVTIREFYLARTEVTQAQWRAVAALPMIAVDLPSNPSAFVGDDLPVENVTWDQAREFCARLTARLHRFYRLPSESEWEYACRAGTTTAFANGATLSTDIANFDGTVAYGAGRAGASRGKTVPVGSLPSSNAFGLADMHGNVWEWCFGQYHDSWTGAPTDGSSWLEGGDNRLRACRGGSYASLVPDCRSANRSGLDVYDAPRGVGFRILMRPGAPDPWAK